MTGCKGYGLRGSDARTEIEHTKEADTPGEIPDVYKRQVLHIEPAVIVAGIIGAMLAGASIVSCQLDVYKRQP